MDRTCIEYGSNLYRIWIEPVSNMDQTCIKPSSNQRLAATCATTELSGPLYSISKKSPLSCSASPREIISKNIMHLWRIHERVFSLTFAQVGDSQTAMRQYAFTVQDETAVQHQSQCIPGDCRDRTVDPWIAGSVRYHSTNKPPQTFEGEKLSKGIEQYLGKNEKTANWKYIKGMNSGKGELKSRTGKQDHWIVMPY